jgi:hypothetical protein
VLRGTIVIAFGMLAFACYILILGGFESMLGFELRSVHTAYELSFVWIGFGGGQSLLLALSKGIS